MLGRNDSFFTATYSENILFSYMSFSNLLITVEGLPEVQSIPFKPIHRDYLKVLRISWFIFFFLLLAGSAALIFFIDELQNKTANAKVLKNLDDDFEGELVYLDEKKLIKNCHHPSGSASYKLKIFLRTSNQAPLPWERAGG